MNILTKICIGVLVLLVLVATPVFITKATVDPNYKDAYAKALADKDAMRVAAENSQVVIAGLVEQNKRLSTDVLTALDAKAKCEKAREDDAATALAAKAELQQSNTNLGTLSTVSASNALGAVALAADLQKELTKSQTEAAEAKTKNHDLSVELANMISLKERMEKQVLTLKDQMEQLTADLVKATKNAGSGASTSAAPADQTVSSTADKFTGTITSVKNGLAGINIGSSNGVKKGDVLVIYRNGKGFVGYLTIEDVYANEAAGVVKDQTSDPVQGDKVTNKVQS